MISRLFLAVFGLGLALAQQEYRLYTNGPGGEQCSKHHVCLKEAHCVDKMGVPMCECTDPKMSGNGKLQCLPSQDHNVWIQNDPHMKNFHREFASLHTPCPYRVLNLVFRPDKDIEIFLDLFAQNELFHEGHYFLSKLTMSTTVYLANDMMKQVMQFEGDVHSADNSQFLNYTLLARSLDTTLSEQPKGMYNVVSTNDTRFEEYTMTVDKDAVDNLLLVSIKGLGITLFFRPPNEDASLDNMFLPLVPGAVFNIKRENWGMVDEARSEFDIASFPDGPSLKDKATELQVSKPLYVQYLLLANSTTEIGYDDSVCYETHRIFKDVCQTEEDKLSMLAVCNSIYSDPAFLYCLTEQHSMEEYRPMHKAFFQMCANSLCSKSSTICEKMQQDMPKVTGCHLPSKIQELDCNSIKGATARTGRGRFYFY
ncbi:hypothetical protein EGW08_007980 [Elysia chlorotica]|uniref:VWFD domain-containing protein n=1 Tax=Elysia chlorotica TaxID=188477 RepID=A0A433TRU9_ELYCH|nr:hypothetical protein EGW08_007980 [Elysia chlorotica]